MHDGEDCDVETCLCLEEGWVLTTAAPKSVLNVPKPKVQHTVLRGNLCSLAWLVRGIAALRPNC